MITQAIISGIIVVLFSVLITFLITSTNNKELYRKVISEKIIEALLIHRQIDHESKSVILAITEHAEGCESRNSMAEVKETVLIIKLAVHYLVRKAGGNPADLGLNI